MIKQVRWLSLPRSSRSAMAYGGWRRGRSCDRKSERITRGLLSSTPAHSSRAWWHW